MSRRDGFPRALAPRATTICFGLFLLVLAAGCGGGGGTEPPDPTAASLTAEGWDAFETGDAATADARFLDALALDPDYVDAYTGRGWVALRGDDYAGATGHFSSALARSAAARDAAAGRVLAEAALDHPQTVRDEGLSLLAAQPGYGFSHDSSYSATDLRWLVARAAMDLGDYPTAVDQLDLLTTDPVPDPQDVGFVEAALALLEALRDQV